MNALLLLALVACSGAPKDPKPADGSPAHSGDTSPAAHSGETGPAGPVGPAMAHASPDAGTLCFACHLCGNDGAGTLETTHWVCVDCHRGPDGAIPEELQSDCGCGTLDCSTEPPTLECEDCHLVDGTNGMPSSQHMNELCSTCHAEGEGALSPRP